MTVNDQGSAQSISSSLDSLKTTPLIMHRITFEMVDSTQWYTVMREARLMFGTNWRSQPRIKRRFDANRWLNKPVTVWFEVPDPAFASWIAVKHAVIATQAPGK